MKEIVMSELEQKGRNYDMGRKLKTIIAVIAISIVFGIVSQYVIDHTIGRFENIYDAIAFNNDFDREDIIDIIYGETIASVIYKDSSFGTTLSMFFHDDGYWVYTGFRSLEYSNEGVTVLVTEPDRGKDLGIRVYIDSNGSQSDHDMIWDCYGTEFKQYSADKFWRYYFGCITPNSSLYTIIINGKQHHIELEQ